MLGQQPVPIRFTAETDTKPKRMSALDAAAQVLKKAGNLLSFDEVEAPDLSDFELSDEEAQELCEEWRREEEAYWAKHGK